MAMLLVVEGCKVIKEHGRLAENFTVFLVLFKHFPWGVANPDLRI